MTAPKNRGPNPGLLPIRARATTVSHDPIPLNGMKTAIQPLSSGLRMP
jgi:hypothetical protein